MRGEFSHAFFVPENDSRLNILYLYFRNAHVQNLGDFSQESQDLEEFCIWLGPDEYAKMRQYFIDHPDPPLI